MVNMGYNKRDIEDSLGTCKYDDITATYLLLSKRTTEVSLVSLKSISASTFEKLILGHTYLNQFLYKF